MSVGPETVSAIFSPRAPWNLCWRMSNRRASSSGGGRFGSSRGNQKRVAVIGFDSRASIASRYQSAKSSSTMGTPNWRLTSEARHPFAADRFATSPWRTTGGFRAYFMTSRNCAAWWAPVVKPPEPKIRLAAGPSSAIGTNGRTRTPRSEPIRSHASAHRAWRSAGVQRLSPQMRFARRWIRATRSAPRRSARARNSAVEPVPAPAAMARGLCAKAHKTMHSAPGGLFIPRRVSRPGKPIVTRDDIRAAHGRIRTHVRRTPVIALEPGAFGLDARLVLKLESLQHTGSFKPRGAFNRILSNPVPPTGVIAASGGNHGIAVAYAAKALGHRAKVFVPEIASAAKVQRIREHGASVVVTPGTYAESLEATT